jgi:GNAT superfamily N-acetyltransferase
MAGFSRVAEAVCETRNVVVDWGAQGKGLGRALMESLVVEARGRGYAGMRAEAPEDVPALVAFYEHAGFVRSPPEMQRAGFVRFERVL